MKHNRISSSFGLCCALTLSVGPALAQTTTQTLYHVSINTSQLAKHDAAPFSLHFALADGSGNADGNASVLLTNFNFGINGDFNSDPSLDGGAAGDLSSAVILQDTQPENVFTGGFIPGDKLTFDVYATLSLDTNGNPDAFEFAITDSAGERLPTVDVNNNNTLVRLTTADGSTINVEAYSTDPSQDPFAASPPVSFGPLVLLDGAPAPGQPTLHASLNLDGTLSLRWPAANSDYTLQQSPDLSNWDILPVSETVAGTNLVVTVAPGDAPKSFYRLKR
jgi:hypothetical protein